MPIWERYDDSVSLTNQADHANRQLLHNQVTDNVFQSADIIFIDGIITVITDTDDLIGVRLLLLHENFLDGQITEDDPAPYDEGVWYSFWCSRGPLVFRLRSKKTLHPEHKLWLNIWKARGSAPTVVNIGSMLFEAYKHI